MTNVKPKIILAGPCSQSLGGRFAPVRLRCESIPERRTAGRDPPEREARTRHSNPKVAVMLAAAFYTQ